MTDELDEMLGVEEKATEDIAVQPEPVKEVVEDEKFKPGVGVDVGTSNIVVSRQTEDGTFVNKYHRNMLFPLDVSEESEDLLERSSYLYVKVNDTYYVVGDDALKLVNAIGKGEVVRPMKDGILNPSLKESSELLFFIIKAIVGKPVVEGETLRFSIPANPIDRDLDNRFHEGLLKNFFSQIGYAAKSVNEAMCIAYDCNPIAKPEEDDEEELPCTGIACSCGAGMWNLALPIKGYCAEDNMFSCTKSGDFLDEQVSQVTGLKQSKVVRIKEKKLDLNNVDMSDRTQAALSIYYDEMLDRMVHHICNRFKEAGSELEESIEVVVAGGTSMAPGFCERLEEAFKGVDMPFEIYAVRHSDTPFFSVAQGASLRAQADFERTKDK